MDDLMEEGSNDKNVMDIFTKHSHHQNITVIYLCQDILWKIRQIHLSQCTLCGGIQESKRSIGIAKFVTAIVSYATARSHGYVQKSDRCTTIRLHAFGLSSGKQR